MSYCRWSSMNRMCDLYCYEHVDGTWITHVASNRRRYAPPEEPDIRAVTVAEWVAAHRETMKALESIPLDSINLPHAGESFRDVSLEAFKGRLLYLRDIGYRFPDYVLEAVDDEIAERREASDD